MAIAPSLFSTNMGKNTSPKCVHSSLSPLRPSLLIRSAPRNRVRASLLTTTLHPARFGEPHEFAQLAVQIVENGYLNGGSASSVSFLHFYRVLACHGQS